MHLILTLIAIIAVVGFVLSMPGLIGIAFIIGVFALPGEWWALKIVIVVTFILLSVRVWQDRQEAKHEHERPKA